MYLLPIQVIARSIVYSMDFFWKFYGFHGDGYHKVLDVFFFLLNWDSLNARLNSHYKAWSYKKKKHNMIKGYRKRV